MVIIADGTWVRMSAIIGICGENFCALLADTRKTTNSRGTYVVADDNTQKIFRLNQNVILGAAGLFNYDESILSALDSISDKSGASLEDIYEAVCRYLESNKYTIPPTRNYIIGGRGGDGRFCVYEVHMNFESYEIETTIRKPDSGEFAITCALPPRAVSMKESIIASVEKSIHTSRTVNEALQKSASVFYEIAQADDTVNTKVMTVMVC